MTHQTLMSPDEAREVLLQLSAYAFPWDVEKSLEFALFRTYAVPTISGLLQKTGAFTAATRKRYDDTELILSEIVENGPDSARGAEALARMNAMHGAYAIQNADMLYVLTTFIFEPQRWIARFGWRDLTDRERDATFVYYRDLGARMGMTDLFETAEQAEAYNIAYEAQHFRPAKSNAVIGNATLDLLLSFYIPRFLFPLGRRAAWTLMDAPLRRAMGFGDPPRWLVWAVPAGLRLRANVLRLLPRRKRPVYLTQRKRPTYPGGYAISDLGTLHDS